MRAISETFQLFLFFSLSESVTSLPTSEALRYDGEIAGMEEMTWHLYKNEAGNDIWWSLVSPPVSRINVWGLWSMKTRHITMSSSRGFVLTHPLRSLLGSIGMYDGHVTVGKHCRRVLGGSDIRLDVCTIDKDGKSGIFENKCLTIIIFVARSLGISFWVPGSKASLGLSQSSHGYTVASILRIPSSSSS